jgi:hypothetical protein
VSKPKKSKPAPRPKRKSFPVTIQGYETDGPIACGGRRGQYPVVLDMDLVLTVDEFRAFSNALFSGARFALVATRMPIRQRKKP